MKRRARCRVAIGMQHRDASQRLICSQVVIHHAMKLAHLTGELQLQQIRLNQKIEAGAHRIGDPGVAPAVDRHSLAAVSAGGKHLHLARIARGKAGDSVPKCVGYQIRSCWSMARWNAPLSLQGLSLFGPPLVDRQKN